MSDPSAPTEPAYRIVSVRRVEPPAGAAGRNWHRYVIAYHGSETVEGYRQGNRREVTRAVEEIVALWNARRCGRRGRVNLV